MAAIVCTTVAMAKIDPARLRDDPFWNKKLDKAIRVTDTNRNGYIERADYMLVVSNYKRLSSASSAYIDTLTKATIRKCDMLGLVDDSVKLTYEEMKKKWLDILQTFVDEGMAKAEMNSMFDSLDMNGDGKIDIDEWRAHYKSVGIPVEHARASFDAMDTNHDGSISKEEFYAYHHEFFTSTEDTLHSSILCGPLDEP